MRLSVDVDPALLTEAKELAGVRTKREAIEIALREMILRRRLKDLMGLEGSGLVEIDLDLLRQWRAASVEG